MKKLPLILATTILFSTGCKSLTSSTTTISPSFEASVLPETDDAYEDYANHLLVLKSSDSYTAGVQNSYALSYSDGTTGSYNFDGVLEVQNASNSPVAHLTENINGNGLQSAIEGYYYDGRLYINYNDVTYYEDMDYDALLDIMQTQLTALSVKQDEMNDIERETNDTSTIFTMSLTDDASTSYFLTRYDISGLSSYENMWVTNGKIVQTFDTNGNFTGEEASFHVYVEIDDEGIDIDYYSNVTLIKLDSTTVEISDELKAEQAEYVAFEDIDTDAISDANIDEDTPEATVTETFAKRLVNRLGYEVQEDGTYYSSFNDNESYTVDFANKQFTYTNYSSKYVYNWSGDTGVFGSSCIYDFTTEQSTSDCEESALEMMQNIKLYFEMELYYCGLSLTDLQSEN